MHTRSQEIKLSPAIGFGIATGQLRKTFFFAKELHLGAEWSMGNYGVLGVSVGGLSSQFTYSDTAGVHVFVNRSTLTIPIAFRRYNPLSAQSSYFIELGLSPSLLSGERKETRARGEVSRERFRDAALFVSLISSIGYKRAIDGNNSFSLGLNNYLDLLKNDKKNPERLRQNRTLLAIVFYRKLNSTPKPKNIEPL
jgi:hypothetical protein